ncbi:serine hydroxymethyltransferase [Candidatus Gottesmanbacteria bacterium RIFCSPHIGHO2_02_FULL_39_11]|uniref:Serine hydroxymethyltransferase n=1 Tax=Candidatus Gottesmanbacteria bacterium RIFCSPHIGHO2_02_FULL_39_11 TaxID=1798382 RepID=A0A1F5ZW34_9BACT|nr:MAG: serine hydroxymethyltransferase [Candidatus Gottesmanbacteria bacterium RIFCSPHIGHO2_02_FULL_39_11]
MKNLSQTDPEISNLITKEKLRQINELEMIPSENYVSPAVLEASGSVLTNKYSEGYPGKRYYAGNAVIDEIEKLAVERAKKLFRVPHVNVQPYSGSPANLAVYMAVCKPGDTIMGLDLTHGGHLTHGWKVSATGIFYKSVQYHVKADGRIDIEEVKKLVREHKPKLIWAGATAYMYEFPFKEFGEIAQNCGAYFACDIAHIAGLIVAGTHPTPVPYAHIVTTTTHKTLRGPRGAMIMVTGVGIKKDPDLPSKIDKAVFPGLQGGPHDNTTAAIAVALHEASTLKFKRYGKQIVKNAKALASGLMERGVKLVGNGTENHLILLDLTPFFGPGGGYFAHYALEFAGIVGNRNTIPGEPSSPFYPSGLRLGTPALTTRGMKEKEMEKIAGFIFEILDNIKSNKLPQKKEDRQPYLVKFREEIKKNKNITQIKKEVNQFASRFPIFSY